MSKRITIYAFDKDSGATYNNTFIIDKNLPVAVSEQFNPPFSRYYTEAEVSDGALPLSDKEFHWIEKANVVDLNDVY